MNTKVSLVRTTDHANLFDGIRQCIDLLGYDKIKVAKKILLKPNCLQDKKEAATTPEVIHETINVIKEIKEGQEYQLFIGDSPGLLAKKSRKIFENLGIMDVIEESGINYVEFDGGKPPIQVQIPEGIRLTETTIAPIIEEVDLIINLPRLKTHGLTIYTGCIKNYWGIQPGGIKAKNHLKGTSTESFSTVITDLYSYLANKPQLCIMDALEGMEGRGGPSSGPLRTLNLIIGGFDPVAVDTVAIAVIGYDALKEVPHVRMCAERNLGVGDLNNIEILGSPLEDVKLIKPFRLPGKGIGWASGLFGPIIYRYTKKIPRLKRKKCIKCGNCAKICPGDAITMNPYPSFNRKKCVNCLCCVETCPNDALRVGIAGFGGLLGIS
ncbi:MAG: DUF362 domain-containing protein [Candidatus Helarchaeota archaeon]|nr:DUF362 domain-containing protein [Candidatus Helarchaeota archaeon]